VAEEVVKESVGLFDAEVKAQSFKQCILIQENGISPPPIFLALLIHHQIGVLLRDSTASNDQLLHFAAILFHLCSQKQASCSHRVVMVSRPVWFVDHGVSAEEAVEKD
jgi:hypothetical protein